jgi:outer membrane protein assembly factor BamD
VNRTVAVLVLVLALGVFSGGCASVKYETMSAPEIYALGEGYFAKERWKDAQEAFEKLKEIHPFSTKVTPAELRIAEALYQRRNHAEATVALEEWLKRHPTNEEVPRAIYYLGKTNYDQKLTIDRDQAFIREANRQFERLATQYRDSEYAATSAGDLSDTRKRLAQRERYVAKFYWKQREYYAALGRYMEVIREYPDTEYYEEAMFFAARCYEHLSDKPMAEMMLNQLLARFPDGKFADRAKSLRSAVAVAP